MRPRAFSAAGYERMLIIRAGAARVPRRFGLPKWQRQGRAWVPECLSDGGDTGSTFSIADFGFSIWMANGLTASAVRLSRGVDVAHAPDVLDLGASGPPRFYPPPVFEGSTLAHTLLSPCPSVTRILFGPIRLNSQSTVKSAG